MRRALVLLALFVLAVLSSCKKRGDEIRVGAYLSLSGADSSFGIDTKEGIDLAVDELNQRGGVKGDRSRCSTRTTSPTRRRRPNKVLQLIDRDKVVVASSARWRRASLSAGGIVCQHARRCR